MKLSEALRRGMKQTKKASGTLFTCNSKGKITHACALGAAILGCAPDIDCRDDLSTVRAIDYLEALLGVDMDRQVESPADGRTRSLGRTIYSLNDKFDWSRSRIAAWLERIGY